MPGARVVPCDRGAARRCRRVRRRWRRPVRRGRGALQLAGGSAPDPHKNTHRCAWSPPIVRSLVAILTVGSGAIQTQDRMSRNGDIRSPANPTTSKVLHRLGGTGRQGQPLRRPRHQPGVLGAARPTRPEGTRPHQLTTRPVLRTRWGWPPKAVRCGGLSARRPPLRGSDQLGNPQVRQGEFELGNLKHLAAGLLGGPAAQSLGHVTGARHRLSALVDHG